MYLSENFLQHIFQCYDTCCSTKFIYHPCNAFSLLRKPADKVCGAHAFRNRRDRKEDRLKAFRIFENIELVYIPENIVDIILVDDQFTELGVYELFPRLIHTAFDLQTYYFLSWNQALPHFGVMEV